MNIEVTEKEMDDIITGLGWMISELQGTTIFSTVCEKRVRNLIERLSKEKIGCNIKK
jgi:hypothetical protein